MSEILRRRSLNSTGPAIDIRTNLLFEYLLKGNVSDTSSYAWGEIIKDTSYSIGTITSSASYTEFKGTGNALFATKYPTALVNKTKTYPSSFSFACACASYCPTNNDGFNINRERLNASPINLSAAKNSASVASLRKSTTNTYLSINYSASGMVNDTWYHSVLTYDGTNLKAYRNGVLYQTVTGTGFYPWGNGGVVYAVMVLAGTANRYIRIKNLRFWENRVLTADEISILYALDMK